MGIQLTDEQIEMYAQRLRSGLDFELTQIEAEDHIEILGQRCNDVAELETLISEEIPLLNETNRSLG